MKRILSILILFITVLPVCKAESSTDRFLSSLSDTWNAFLDMAEDAGKGAAKWGEEKVSDIAAWARENGLTDWAQQTLNDLTAWFDEAGISDWASDTSREVQSFIEDNRPAIEAWLTEAGQSVREAWDTLVNPDQHTAQELEAAYDIVVSSLEEAAG